MRTVAVFEGLVIDEFDQVVNVTYVGNAPHYIVDDAGFLRHIPAEHIDRQVLATMQQGVLDNKQAVVDGMLTYMGKEDLFTKAAIETAIDQMEESMDQLLKVGLPEETRVWLGMMGFKIVIDMHGDILEVTMPSEIDPDL